VIAALFRYTLVPNTIYHVIALFPVPCRVPGRQTYVPADTSQTRSSITMETQWWRR
jgi:hypothetical protein